MKYIIFLCLFLLIIVICNCLVFKKKEGFGGSSTLPNIISKDSFSQYFMVDHGIANCNNGTGCPDNAQDYITGPGIIEWKGGKSATFRTKNPVLPSGYGFVGIKFNSVPTGGSGLWNSIWLMGKDNNGSNQSGALLEVDIYENNTGWGWQAPKLSFHDWQSGHGTKIKDGSDGCFGVYLNGSIGDGNCGKTYGKIIKNWDWNSVKSKIYNGATWYTLIVKQNEKPLVYTGISLKGWLPQSKNEATYNNVLQNSDFLISSGSGNIQGDPKGGYYFCITSTATSPPPDGSKYDIPTMVNYDGESSGGTQPSPSDKPKPPTPPSDKPKPPTPPSDKPKPPTPPSDKPKPPTPPSDKPKPPTPPSDKPKPPPSGPKPSGPKPSGPKPSDPKPPSGKGNNCTLTPATVATGCECSDPNNPTSKLPCSLQPDGQCKISGNDGWGLCAPECCKKKGPEGYSNMIENYSVY